MKKIIALAIATALTTGCASIISKSNYAVNVQSTPDNIQFQIRDDAGKVVHKGVTPMNVNLEAGDGYFKKAKYTVEFMNGSSSDLVQIEGTMDGWYVANILFGGLIGLLIVDPATGAMWKLPETVTGQLKPGSTAKVNQGTTLTVMTINELPKNLHSALIPVTAE